jgi:DNA polymerase I-like protein with 3'-5' exonuclease and polymerase domains
LLKIVQAANAGLDKYMLFPVHDEIDFDVPNEDLSYVLAIIKEIMNDDGLLSVPITWTCNIGNNWGVCK